MLFKISLYIFLLNELDFVQKVSGDIFSTSPEHSLLNQIISKGALVPLLFLLDSHRESHVEIRLSRCIRVGGRFVGLVFQHDVDGTR